MSEELKHAASCQKAVGNMGACNGTAFCLCLERMCVFPRRERLVITAHEKTRQKSAENWIYQLSCTEDLITMSLESHVITLCHHEMKILLASRQFNQLRLEWEGGSFCPPRSGASYILEKFTQECVFVCIKVCVCVHKNH